MLTYLIADVNLEADDASSALITGVNLEANDVLLTVLPE